MPNLEVTHNVDTLPFGGVGISAAVQHFSTAEEDALPSDNEQLPYLRLMTAL